ncbi:MAG: CopD family protein [Gammaproteobacteria bacterium]|nr:CopD family protein [Gammaproteobacteria bacterium]
MLYLKVLHLTFAFTWFAALFYLPRLFVYHSQSSDEFTVSKFKTMERKLYRGIMTPSALLTLVFGLWITSFSWVEYVSSTWFWCKVGCVFLLFGYHGMCGRMVRSFYNDRNTRTPTFYRIFNEVPLVFLLAILTLAIVKPFETL